MATSDPLPELIEGVNYRHIKIPLLQNYSSVFLVNGECDSYLWFTTKVINSVEYVTSHSGLNIKTNGTIYISADIPDDADYLYFQFSNYNSSTNVLEGLKISEISGGNASITKITSDIVLLSDTTPTLTTGLYVLANAEIFIGSSSPSNVVFGKGEIIYYDSTATTFYGNFNMVALNEGTWGITQNDIIENSLTNSRNKIPTSQAVYNAIQGGFITKISSDITLIPDTPLTLTTGLYLLENAVIYFGSAQPTNVVFGKGEIIYYDSTATTLYGDFNIVALEQGTWGIRQNDIIENTLTNSRNRIPTSQAVYTAIQNEAIKTITSDILLDSQTPPALTTGLYVLENAGIYRTSISPSNTLFGSGEIIYYDAMSNVFYGSFIKAYIDTVNNYWAVEQNERIDETTLSNTTEKIPTSYAVYKAIESACIKCSTSSHQSLTPTGTGTGNAALFNLSSDYSYGNCFQITSNGYIKVLKDITLAFIIGRANPYGAGTNNKTVGIVIRLKRNGTWSNIVGGEITTAEPTFFLNLTEMTNLKENDEIAIGFFTQTSGVTATSAANLSISTFKI